MRPLPLTDLVDRFKPDKGYTQLVHFSVAIILPVLVLILVNNSFMILALILIVLSKWRIFSVRPRFWLANIRANMVDLFVGLSFLAFIIDTSSLGVQIVWMILYATWLAFVKPGSKPLMVAAQAGLGLLAGLSALLLYWGTAPTYWLALASGVICYFTARHFLNSFDEPYVDLLSYTWGYFGAALMWVLAHWLLFYGSLAQPTVLLVAIAYGLGALYYLDHYDKLTRLLRQQFIFIMLAIIVIVLTLSNWGDKVV